MKYDDEDTTDNSEPRSFNFTLSKAENELFNEKANVAQRLISVKRRTKRDAEDWEILENNKVVLLMHGTRFNSAEKTFLRTVDGIKFVLAAYKDGATSTVKIKKLMSKVLKKKGKK